MSFWENFNLKKYTQTYSEDGYENDDGYGDDLYEDDEPLIPTGRNNVDPMREVDPHAAGKSEPATFSGKVLNMNANKPSVVLFRPTGFSDASKAADDLRDKKAVIVNMENVDRNVSRRVVDFLTGCAYALDGKVKKIAQSTYLFCPNSMEVAGDLESIQVEAESST